MAGKTPNSSRYTEVERKFEVVDSTVAPSFGGLSAVSRVERLPVQQLDAVYFDTPGRDLAAHRITLRRRTGGTDAGWHLKLPAGPDARTEVHSPLSGDENVWHRTSTGSSSSIQRKPSNQWMPITESA